MMPTHRICTNCIIAVAKLDKSADTIATKRIASDETKAFQRTKLSEKFTKFLISKVNPRLCNKERAIDASLFDANVTTVNGRIVRLD